MDLQPARAWNAYADALEAYGAVTKAMWATSTEECEERYLVALSRLREARENLEMAERTA